MISVVPGPFSTKGKQEAVQKEVRENYETYFAKAAKTRLWFPDKLPERNQMADYGHLITEDTKEILLGFLGVESIVDDYVYSGLKAAGDSLSTKELYIQWGYEERRHGQTFRHSLIDSGLYSQEFIDKFLHETLEHHWTFEDQTGYEETPLLGAAYAIFQERQTRRNYTYTRIQIWEEYGSPCDANGKRIFPAIAGAIRFPEIDEGAHEANFTNIVRIYMKYFPDLALDALVKVSKNYQMPAVQMPNAERFIQCILATKMGDARKIISEIMNPALEKMGLENRQALRKAVKNFNLLPENAIVNIEGRFKSGINPDDDTPIYTMKPNGEFILTDN
ncbi:MAG: hypothetical protein CL785_00455 [Chloroflexi bacterium]|nr:hypothetical protein [Chloroflexota bacterium]